MTIGITKGSKYICGMEYNFTLAEMTRSSTAEEMKIENTPSQEDTRRMCRVLDRMEEVRNMYGKPILITSGFRSQKLNEAIRGAKRSKHMRGEAVDITPTVATKENFEELATALGHALEGGVLTKVIVEAKKTNGKVIAKWFHAEYVKGEVPWTVQGILNGGPCFTGDRGKLAVLDMYKELTREG